MKLKSLVVTTVVAMLALLGTSAYATAIVIDSVGDTGNLVGTIGGTAKVFGLSPVLQGVGNSKVFLTIQNDGTEKGYNTTGTVEFDTTASGTTALLISELATASFGGVSYYQFVFALNSTGGAGTTTMSINQIRIFQATAGDLTGYPTFGGNATTVFNWVSGNDTLTVDDYISGLSNTELLLMVPTTAFSGGGSNVILYMDGGSPLESDDGPDKWIARDQCSDFGLTGVTCGTTQVPEPTSLLLLGSGLAGIALAARRKARGK